MSVPLFRLAHNGGTTLRAAWASVTRHPGLSRRLVQLGHARDGPLHVYPQALRGRSRGHLTLPVGEHQYVAPACSEDAEGWINQTAGWGMPVVINDASEPAVWAVSKEYLNTSSGPCTRRLSVLVGSYMWSHGDDPTRPVAGLAVPSPSAGGIPTILRVPSVRTDSDSRLAVRRQAFCRVVE